MSAPNTNVEKQKRRHIVPLVGIGLAALFGVFLLLGWLFGEVQEADPVNREDLPAAAPVSDVPPDATMPGAGTDAPVPLPELNEGETPAPAPAPAPAP